MNWLAHRRMKRAVSAYVDGELDPRGAAAVADHLRKCWGCSGDVDLIRTVKHSLRNLANRHGDSLAVTRLRRFASGLKH